MAREKAGYRRKGVAAFLIRNGRLTTEWSDVDPLTLSIAEKAVSTMINYSGVNDLYRMYLETQRANAAYNVAYIGEDFRAPHPFEFDPDLYAGALSLRLRQGREGISLAPCAAGF